MKSLRQRKREREREGERRRERGRERERERERGSEGAVPRQSFALINSYLGRRIVALFGKTLLSSLWLKTNFPC